MKTLDYVALSLVIIGAVNWGLIGFLQFNLVDTIFMTIPAISRIIYSLVGLAGLYCLTFFSKDK